MLPLSIRMTIQTLLFVLVISLACGQDRKIKSSLNPGCVACTSDNPLVYTRAAGSSDTIHQIWDFSQGAPTIIFAVGGLNSSLNISWDGHTPSMFSFDEEPKYSFAASLDQLFEYDDLEDSGHITPQSPQKAYPMAGVRWRSNHSHFTEKEAALTVQGELKRGIVEITLDLLPFEDYASQLPHLIHTANSTLVDVSLVNLTTWRRYNASRFALHFALVGTDGADGTMHYAIRKTLDDEHTPGVFEIVEIKTPACYAHGAGGFLQFRPVGYTQRARGVTTSTLAHVSNFNAYQIPQRSTLASFYRGANQAELLVQDMFISIGETGDGYYRQHNYTAWSFSMGYGAPPLEGFSPFVLGIIAAGLAVPAALALSGVVYVVVRRRRQMAAAEPTRFTDEE